MGPKETEKTETSTSSTNIASNSGQGNRVPPLLSKCKSYADWCKKIKIWAKITSVSPLNQGGAILMTLDGEAEDKVLELDEDKILCENGITNIITQLDQIYKKNSTVEKFEALDNFETYRRPSDTAMSEFLIEFDKRKNKTQSLGTEISDDLLAYRLIKAANLSDSDERVVKATVQLNYTEVRDKLRSIFGESSGPSKTIDIKKEDVFLSNDTMFQRSSNRYGKGKYSKKKPDTILNPLDESGNHTVCVICKSIYHWANKCPHKSSNKVSSDISICENTSDTSDNPTLFSHYVMCQSEVKCSSGVFHLLTETWNSAILDSGATKTVAGKPWFENFCKCLPAEERVKIRYSKSSSNFRFGDGESVQSDQNVIIPCTIGKKNVDISVDIINKDIPLLLSRESMKKAKMELNFKTDTAIVFGEKVKLKLTKSGHYTIPLTRPIQLLNEFESDENYKFTLVLNHCPDSKRQAKKLHLQFAHATSEKLLKLLKSAGLPWCNDKALMDEIKNVERDCETCSRYKKAPPRPVVGLPMAKAFNECVAMDLKFFQGKIILHMIDHASRYSAGCRIASKEPEVVIKAIFMHWIKIHGSPIKFLTDNGGEFVNQSFMDLCGQFNVCVKTTAAESPWSNGLVERHNLVISDMLEKVLDSEKCDFDLALSWCIQAKNGLLNVNGYTPCQIGMGKNPVLPSVLSDYPTTYESATSSQVLENLQVMRAARKSFIEAESSQKIKKALMSKTRSSNGVKFVNGDLVFFKRKDENRWKGPATVIGQDGQQVILKHGGYIIRVHPCRVLLKTDYDSNSYKQEPTSLDSFNINDENDENKVVVPDTTIDELDTDEENDETNPRNNLVPESEEALDENMMNETVLRRSTRNSKKLNYKDLHEGKIQDEAFVNHVKDDVVLLPCCMQTMVDRSCGI